MGRGKSVCVVVILNVIGKPSRFLSGFLYRGYPAIDRIYLYVEVYLFAYTVLIITDRIEAQYTFQQCKILAEK